MKSVETGIKMGTRMDVSSEHTSSTTPTTSLVMSFALSDQGYK